MDSIYAKRTTWVDFPPILVLYALNTLKNLDEDLYIQAKSGNELSAIKLLTQLMTQKDIASIKHCLQGKSPIIAPVLAIEFLGNNRLPMVFGQILANELNLPITFDIVQAVKANHTKASAYERIVRQAIFTGEVERGREYLIVDDAVAMGGTLAGLKGYIETMGGKVIQAVVLTGYQLPFFDIVPTQKMIQLIQLKHPDLAQWWQNEFHFPLEYLTSGELGHFKKPKSLDEIRNRLIEAGLQKSLY